MKYLVELNSSDVSADFLLSELHLEFGRAPESSGDTDIFKLKSDKGIVLVLSDYDNNRLWLTIEASDESNYEIVAKQIEDVLNRSKDRGFINWSQIELKE